MKLNLSESLTLPGDAVTQTFGILSVRGAGKTNTAVVMAEEMYAAALPFVVVDPVGVWFGLRSSDAGLEALGELELLPTGPALVEYWIGEVGQASAAMLRVLVDAYPTPLTREEVAEATGYSSEELCG